MTNKYTYSPPFDKEQLEFEYAMGLTQAEIAERYHTTQKVVWRAMKNFKIEARTAKKRDQSGENNDSWRGSEACYAAFHKRIEALNGKPQKCEICGTVDVSKTYDWACLTGRYDDPSDYKRMCRSCHSRHDNTVKNLGEYAIRKGGDTK